MSENKRAVPVEELEKWIKSKRDFYFPLNEELLELEYFLSVKDPRLPTVPVLEPLEEAAEEFYLDHDANCAYWQNRLEQDCDCGAVEHNECIQSLFARFGQSPKCDPNNCKYYRTKSREPDYVFGGLIHYNNFDNSPGEDWSVWTVDENNSFDDVLKKIGEGQRVRIEIFKEGEWIKEQMNKQIKDPEEEFRKNYLGEFPPKEGE